MHQSVLWRPEVRRLLDHRSWLFRVIDWVVAGRYSPVRIVADFFLSPLVEALHFGMRNH